MKDINVLLVEDYPEVREIIKTFLKILEVRDVYECRDGLEALAIVNKRNEVGDLLIPDIQLIICDIYMPGLDGITFLKEIRKHEKLNKVPVIMISGDGTEKKIVESIKAGADSYIVKPCSLKTIEEKIMMALKKRSIIE